MVSGSGNPLQEVPGPTSFVTVVGCRSTAATRALTSPKRRCDGLHAVQQTS